MAFRPDTTYTINGTTYSTFYDALIAVGSKPTGTQIKDASGKVVFTKDDNANDFYLYQFNDYITKASDWSCYGEEIYVTYYCFYFNEQCYI